jgi:arginine deiminase
MKSIARNFTLALATAAAFALPVAHAREDMDIDKFVTMADANRDGMVSKAEMMKRVEKLFEKHDVKKQGMLEKSQVERFLKDLMHYSGA